MSPKYSVIEIYSNEEARWQNTALPEAIINLVRDKKIAGRCMIFKGTGACYENGEIATQSILTLSYNMPIKIEILLPTPELDHILPVLTKMIDEGIVGVRDLNVICHKTRKRLIPRHIRVRDIMTRQPKKVSLLSPLNEVAQLLLSAIFTGIPVVDEKDHPKGIVTQGDLIYRANMPIRIGLLDESDSNSVDNILNSLSQKYAKDIMTQPVVTVNEDKRVTSAVDLMLENKVKRLPVVDKEGKLTGMLSRLDVFQIITKELPDWNHLKKQNIIVENLLHVKDIMRRDTQTVLPGSSIEEVIQVIDTDDIQRIAVVNASGYFMGMISDRDLLMAFSDHRPGIWNYLSKLIPFSEKGKDHDHLQKEIRQKTAEEVMETHLITVMEETGIDDAIRLMIENGFKRLPVLDKEGIFKGMISRDSLLRTGFAKDP